MVLAPQPLFLVPSKKWVLAKNAKNPRGEGPVGIMEREREGDTVVRVGVYKERKRIILYKIYKK